MAGPPSICRRFPAVAIAAALTTVPLPAAPAEDKIGWVPRALLERSLTLREGVGPVHETVTTSLRDAQAFYDQGLAYLHAAGDEFSAALKLWNRADPDLLELVDARRQIAALAARRN